MRDNSVEYTFTTPGGVFTFTRVDGAVTRLKDIAFNAQVRARISDRTQKHGARIRKPFKSGGTLNVTLQTRPENGSAAAVEASRSSLVRCVNSLMLGDGTLEWTNRGAVDPIVLSGLSLPSDLASSIQNAGWMWNLQLASSKPFAEDATATVVDSAPLSAGGGGFTIPLSIPFTITASAGGDLEVNHVGDFPEAYPVLQAFGPLTNPILINQLTGERLVFDGSIAAGDYWEIDLWERTVTLNGSTPIRALRASQSTWWSVQLGVNPLQLAGSGYTSATKLRANMKSSWG